MERSVTETPLLREELEELEDESVFPFTCRHFLTSHPTVVGEEAFHRLHCLENVIVLIIVLSNLLLPIYQMAKIYGILC